MIEFQQSGRWNRNAELMFKYAYIRLIEVGRPLSEGPRRLTKESRWLGRNFQWRHFSSYIEHWKGRPRSSAAKTGSFTLEILLAI
jgi:hypothetical protein